MTADKTVKVRVSDRWRVVHDGKPYVEGDVVEVPENVAADWIQSGWVVEVQPGAAPSKTAPRKRASR